MNTLSHYLSQVRKTHASGAVPETSYYPHLAELLTTIGKVLSPKVHCVVHPKSQGAGIPDLALFSADQIPASGQPSAGVIPSRGVIEAKGPGADVDKIAASPQVAKYRERYGQVLVTNLREFLLVTGDGPTERFTLAATEAAFWGDTDDSTHEAFADFLRRALLSNAPIALPKDLAWLLAYYAREARRRILGSDLEALDQLRASLEESLGITFSGERGDNFFRSTLIQTLFYGVFSAWVLWSQRQPVGKFDWKTASFELRVPMIRALFYQVAEPSRLRDLGLVEVLDWAGDALNRVDRDAFFGRFAADNAVQYFYEPFLEAFDPELRKELGVWYTPREIVRYQVERVDTVLREELGVAAGLADPNVVVLDPCCGTGAYLVEVLRLICDRLTGGAGAASGDVLALNEVKKAATSRVFGFEILPAPFVVAHLQLGLLLQTMRATLSAKTNERVGVYLTNALTGWDGEPPQKAMIFPELLAERDAAGRVKREAKILVIIGNPPYNGFAGMAVEEERSLSNAYRTVKTVPRPQGQGLNDLYVRFFRMAERRIVDGSPGKGIISFISNYSWLDGLSFTGMRERYAEVFDRIYIDNGNGDKYRTGKVTPEGKPDPSVFSTPYNREGIQVGTAIATLVRNSPHRSDGAQIFYRDFWGKDKLAQIGAASSQQPAASSQQPAASSQQPAASSQQPAASSQQPAASSQQPAASSQQPAASSQQPAASSQQPAASSQQPAASSQQPAASSQQPAASSQQPAASSQQPAASSQQPAASSQQPAASSQQPAASSQQPAASSQQPAASSQQPAASSQQPAASSQQPAASSQQPAASSQQKISTYPSLHQSELACRFRPQQPEQITLLGLNCQTCFLYSSPALRRAEMMCW